MRGGATISSNDMLDHVRLQQLGPEGMQRRLEGDSDGDEAAEKGCQTSNAEALRHLRVQPQPATQVNPRGQG